MTNLMIAMQKLGDMTATIDLPTSYGSPLECYRRGMKSLVDHGRFGDGALLRRARECANELRDVHERWSRFSNQSSRRHGEARDALQAFVR
jgi:hypothetical protein